MDFDVYALPNSTEIFKILTKFDCVATREEEHKLNSGFLACKKDAAFPKAVMNEYHRDYRPGEWVYNSGIYPMFLYRNSELMNRTVFVDDTIANYPNVHHEKEINQQFGLWEWKHKLAIHHFNKRCDFTYLSLSENTTFAEISRFILETSLNRSLLQWA